MELNVITGTSARDKTMIKRNEWRSETNRNECERENQWAAIVLSLFFASCRVTSAREKTNILFFFLYLSLRCVRFQRRVLLPVNKFSSMGEQEKTVLPTKKIKK